MKHILRSTHLKYGVIAGALLVTTLFIGLSAYLTTSSDAYDPMFRTATGEEFGLSISGAIRYTRITEEDTEDDILAKAQRVTPGQSITLSPTVENSGSLPMYVFAKINTGGLTLGELGSAWHAVEGVDGVYYYGTDASCNEFNTGAESTVFDDLIVPTNARTDSTFSPSIVAYGIQTENLGTEILMADNQPKAIWDEIIGGT